MKRLTIGVPSLLAALGIVFWLAAPWLPLGLAQTSSANDRAYFFRLIAKYMHGNEPVDFDIVVGCGVRVTAYGDDSSSYDAFRDPIFFAKPTKDGAAVLQIVPDACAGQTTSNGRVPKDFLPGAIWFDSKDNLLLGVAYIAEDAFENPKGKLKFLGATIHPATKEEWETFRPIHAQNLLSPKPFTHIPPRPSIEEIKAHLWDRKKQFEMWPIISCKGVIRFGLSEPEARKQLQKYWPDSRPRFWMPNGPERKAIMDSLEVMNNHKGPLIGNHYYREYFRIYETGGFSTRNDGGNLDSIGGVASEVFPRRADDGLPWLKPEVATTPVIYRDVDLAGGRNAGLAYCYHSLRVGSITEAHLPNYFDRHFATRVDGELVQFEDEGPDFPSPFFENDEYFYLEFHFSLS